METYETVIVGGGPAGLAAAIHLAWHRRRVLIVDRRSGPLFFTLEKLQNVPGMPAARGIDIQSRLRAQAEELGAAVVRGNAVSVSGEEGAFLLHGEAREQWAAATLLLACGVARYHPTVGGDFQPCFKYAGKENLFYCADCEAPETAGKDTIVIGVGPADWAAGLAVGLTRYTDRLRVLLTGGRALSAAAAGRLRTNGIEVLEGEIVELVGQRLTLQALELADGRRLNAEAFFVSSPARGRTDLARQIGVEIAATGHHAEPRSQRGDTNIPGVWVAGDLRPMTQQVSVAIGTGNIAAVMIDQYLRKRETDR